MAKVFNLSAQETSIPVIGSVYGTLAADKYLGRPLPGVGFTQDDFLNMQHLHYWFNFLKLSNDLSKAINTGKLTKILADFDDRIAHPSEKSLKWTFLSAHDTDATCMMNDLNISSAQCVEDLYRTGQTEALNCSPAQEYATSLIYELHSEDGKEFVVRIRQDGEYVYLCERKEISCGYEEWRGRVKKLLVDVESICGSAEDAHN